MHIIKLKRLFTSLTFLFLCLVNIQAQEVSYDGIFVIANGSNECYLISEHPVVSYSEDNKMAFLTLDGSSDPVLSIPITGNNALQIVYGSYHYTVENNTATSVENITVSTERKSGKKIITGGKVFILKDNKLYSANGTLIK